MQMLANLLENAPRHTQAGTRIAVPARVLRRFHRLDPSRSDRGSGLALVAAVAELPDPALELTAARADGRGLRVSLRFPAPLPSARRGGRPTGLERA